MWHERSDRLDKITKNCERTENLPLLKEISRPLWESNNLNTAVLLYLSECKRITNQPNLKDLPNRTPNGLILPKREVLHYYNIIHQLVNSILVKTGISDHIDLIHCPINIRHIDTNKKEVDTRPHSSTKLHSDIWAGELTNTTMVFIPIFGMFGSQIEFYEPDESFLSYIRILEDYNEGIPLLEKSKKYNVRLSDHHIYLTDPFLLHRTVKTYGERVSLDFRFISKIQCKTDIEIETFRKKDYIKYDEWAKIGFSKSLYTKFGMTEFEDNRNEYSGNYEIKEWK